MCLLVFCSLLIISVAYCAPLEDHQCGDNEEWKSHVICDSFCVEFPYNCTDPVFASEAKCMCKQGFVRGANQRCVLVADCPSGKTMKNELSKESRNYLAENDPCQLTDCEENQICKNKPIPCLEGPCPLIADCVNKD
uniref:TIL domain-containing protein n=1 Tax=Steinernema glaseri TaxID=37863 RepID=A0A1I7YUC4_9BILA